MTRGAALASRVIAQVLDVTPLQVHAEGGGCINDCFSAELPDHAKVFVKLNTTAGMFPAEAAGLQALADTETIRVPRVLGVGEVDGHEYLVMEHIAMAGERGDSYTRLGTMLAKLHAHKGEYRFGFDIDNFIGSTPQPNAWRDKWIQFYGDRLRFQLKLLTDHGQVNAGFRDRVTTVIEHLDAFFDPNEDIVPSLLHGDLWSGNWGFAEETGEPVIFDPATYWGHNEAELAMMTLFGRPPKAFYDAYFAIIPKAPRHDQRAALYQLYHALNHFNLFGAGYKGMCEGMLRELLRTIEHP